MKSDLILEKYGLDVDLSFEEFDKKYPKCFKTSSFGRSYPQVALHVGKDVLWVEFEYDLSRIRHIEKSDDFKRRHTIYQRHGVWSFIK